MKTVTSAPVDFDRWMQNHGPRKDTPTPKPAPAGKANPKPKAGGTWGAELLVDGGDGDYIWFPTDDPNTTVVIIVEQNPDFEWKWGYLDRSTGTGVHDDQGNGVEWQSTDRQTVTDWLQSQGVPLPSDRKWNHVDL